MNYFSIRETKNLLKSHNLSPRKGLGQNFLIDKTALQKMVDTADLKPNDYILEIGPGLGVLTLELAKRSKKVLAIEKDEKMANVLKDILKQQNISNVEIIAANALATPYTKYKILNTRYKVVANLPYYITAPVIRKFLESEQKPESMVLMVQKEVGQRICSKPPRMNLLAVSVQFYAKPEVISFISKKCFWPEPKVDSTIIKLNIKKEKSEIDSELFFKIVKAGFSQPRKQILGNLSKRLKLNRDIIAAWLAENNIKPEQRAETLSMDDWLRLCRTF